MPVVAHAIMHGVAGVMRSFMSRHDKPYRCRSIGKPRRVADEARIILPGDKARPLTELSNVVAYACRHSRAEDRHVASRGHSSDTLDLSFRELQDDLRNDEPLAFLEKRVVGRIGHGQKRPRGFAWPFDNAALGVESLDRRDTGQLTRSAMG